MKNRRVIFELLPCVVVTSLETSAFVAIIACIDMLIDEKPSKVEEREYSSKRSKIEKVLKEQLLFWERKNQFLRIRIQRLVFCRKLGKRDWTLRRDTPLNYQSSPGVTLKFGKEKGNLDAISQKVNLMSEILARPSWRKEHLRKLQDKKST